MADKKTTYDHVGSAHVFRERPPEKPDFGWVWGVLVFIGVIFLLGQCSG